MGRMHASFLKWFGKVKNMVKLNSPEAAGFRKTEDPSLKKVKK